jgi:hypothetical protein
MGPNRISTTRRIPDPCPLPAQTMSCSDSLSSDPKALDPASVVTATKDHSKSPATRSRYRGLGFTPVEDMAVAKAFITGYQENMVRKNFGSMMMENYDKCLTEQETKDRLACGTTSMGVPTRYDRRNIDSLIRRWKEYITPHITHMLDIENKTDSSGMDRDVFENFVKNTFEKTRSTCVSADNIWKLKEFLRDEDKFHLYCQRLGDKATKLRPSKGERDDKKRDKKRVYGSPQKKDATTPDHAGLRAEMEAEKIRLQIAEVRAKRGKIESDQVQIDLRSEMEAEKLRLEIAGLRAQRRKVETEGAFDKKE